MNRKTNHTGNASMKSVICKSMATLLLASAIAGPALAELLVPFSGVVEGTEDFDFEHPSGVDIKISGSGEGIASRLGPFTSTWSGDITFTNPDNLHPVERTFVAANGDELWSEGLGSGTPPMEPDFNQNVTGEYRITGGTGRFTGAGGSFTVDRVVYDVRPGVNLETVGSFDGFISTPHAKTVYAGTPRLTGAGTPDGFTNLLYVNEGQPFDLSKAGATEGVATEFNFWADRRNGVVTPFIAEVVRPKSFIVRAIGTTRVGRTDWDSTGLQQFAFSDDSQPTIQDGWVAGFMSSYPDGSGGVSPIPYANSNVEGWLTGSDDRVGGPTIALDARPGEGDFATDVNAHGMRRYQFQIGVEMAVLPDLRPGDADQDLDFDQLDLVQVQVAAKYLTGQAATWGEGDWNGEPIGKPGNPTAGDGLFNQFDIIAAQQAAAYLQGPYSAIQTGGSVENDQTSLVYNAGTGELAVNVPSRLELTSLNVTSASGKFIGTEPAVLDGAFDNFAADNVFKTTFGGSFGSISFGNILPVDISEAELASDLSAVGSLAGGGDLGDVALVYIPEPATATLFLCGFLALRLLHRRP